MRRRSFFVPAQAETERLELLGNFLKRLLTEVTHLDHFFLGTADKIRNRVDSGALQTVEAADGQVKILNGHLKNLLFGAFAANNHYFSVLCFIRQIHKQVEMLVENLGAE